MDYFNNFVDSIVGGGIFRHCKTLFFLQRRKFMKKTLIVLMMVLLAAMLIVSCEANSNNNGSSSTLPEPTKKGSTITLGGVEWKALKVDTNKKQALLISNEILELRAFDSDSNDYKTSDIRTYLQSDEFFSTYNLDKSYMLEVDVLSKIEKTVIKENGGDYVFLLSLMETDSGADSDYYFASVADRVAYTKANESGMKEAKDWWLRSPATSYVDYVKADGYQDNVDSYTTTKGIRPAFWYSWN